MRPILTRVAIVLLGLALARPGTADASDLIVFGPVASSVDRVRVKPVASAMSKLALGSPAVNVIDVACATTPACLATAGARAGGRQALAVVIAGDQLAFVLVDVGAQELIARREVTIAERRLEKELPRALQRFIADAPTERAKLLFNAGNRHYELGEYAEALAIYKQAYRVKPLPAFQFNIAQCHRKLGQHADAIAMYQAYLVGVPGAPNKELVDSLIGESQHQLANEQQLARERERAHLEAATTRAEEARKAKEAEAAAAAERRKVVQARLDAERAAQLEKTYNQHPARGWMIATGILGAATAGVGGYVAYRARNAQTSFDDAGCGDPTRNLPQPTLAACAADRDQGKRDARLANILIGSGGAVVAASLLVFILDPGNLERPRERATVAVTPTSVQVQAVIRW